jgi:hypothetical protein
MARKDAEGLANISNVTDCSACMVLNASGKPKGPVSAF